MHSLQCKIQFGSEGCLVHTVLKVPVLHVWSANCTSKWLRESHWAKTKVTATSCEFKISNACFWGSTILCLVVIMVGLWCLFIKASVLGLDLVVIWPESGLDLLRSSNQLSVICWGTQASCRWTRAHMMPSTKARLQLSCIMSLCLCLSCDVSDVVLWLIRSQTSFPLVLLVLMPATGNALQSHNCTPSFSVHPCQWQCSMFMRWPCQTHPRDRWSGHRNTPEYIRGKKWQRIDVSTLAKRIVTLIVVNNVLYQKSSESRKLGVRAKQIEYFAMFELCGRFGLLRRGTYSL